MSVTANNWPGIARHGVYSDCFCYGDNEGCACGPEEKALRLFADGLVSEAMSPSDREWCLSEIERVEGHERAEHTTDTDRELANGVLTAWTDFCRDKGLL